MDRDLFIRVVERWKDTVFRLAFGYMKCEADADDVTQTVFLKLYQAKPEFASEEHIRNWLIRVTINECRSLLRSWWRRREDLETYADRIAMEPDQKELLEDVMALPEKYRIPLYLFYYEGCSCEEIGELLRIPPATVRTRLARARKQLRILLEEGDGS